MTRGGYVSAFYDHRQIAELKTALGITLDNTDGLLNEKQFTNASGLTKTPDYRNRGLIKPIGYAMTNAGLSPFYHPRQISELKTALGITLTNTDGLLNEYEFRKTSGLSQIADYRERGLIKPVGTHMVSNGIGFFYHPHQIAELKTALGITLDSIEGLLNETEFKKNSGLTNIAKYRRNGLITPVGFAMAGPGVGPFYHPRQIAELKKRLTELRAR